LIYGSNFSNTGTIRKFVSLLCDTLYIDPIIKFKMILITDELNNNAIEYGSLEKDVNKMRISISKDDLCYNFIIEAEDS
jgi:two-component sensor histidine kinase